MADVGRSRDMRGKIQQIHLEGKEEKGEDRRFHIVILILVSV